MAPPVLTWTSYVAKFPSFLSFPSFFCKPCEAKWKNQFIPDICILMIQLSFLIFLGYHLTIYRVLGHLRVLSVYNISDDVINYMYKISCGKI